MCSEDFTVFVGLEGWPGWTILKKQHLEIFNLERMLNTLRLLRSMFEKTFLFLVWLSS